MSNEVLTGPTISEGPYEAYFSLPKHIGAVDPKILLRIADTIETSPNLAASSQAQTIIASSLIEAGILLYNNDDDSLEYRLWLVDEGIERLKKVKQVELARLESGYYHPDFHDEYLRAKMRLLFEHVYKDLVCSDISDATREELLDNLARLRRDAFRVFEESKSPEHKRTAAGLIGELHVFISAWGKGKIAIPSSARGGRGGEPYADETHDIVLLEISENGTVISVGTQEVKTGENSVTLHHVQRYNAELVRATLKGTIEIIRGGKK